MTLSDLFPQELIMSDFAVFKVQVNYYRGATDTRLLCYKRHFLETAIELLVSLSVRELQAMGVMGNESGTSDDI